jgi:hypothetical protein
MGGGTRSAKFAHTTTNAPTVRIEVLLDFSDRFFF